MTTKERAQKAFYLTPGMSWQAIADAIDAAVKEVEAQLPEGMKHCTIIFKECPLGHGWLTATNWAPFDCPTCARAAAVAEEKEACAKIVQRFANGKFIYQEAADLIIRDISRGQS